MSVIATLNSASVTESQLGFKTDLLNSSFNKKLFKTFYSDLDPLDLTLPLEQLKPNDMLYNSVDRRLWSYRPNRINHTILDVTNIDEDTSVASPSTVLASTSFTTLVDGTGILLNFKDVGDYALIVFKNIDILVGNGTFNPSYFELEYTDIGDPNGIEQNRPILSNIIVSVSTDGVTYEIINDLYSLQNKPFINILSEVKSYTKENILYLKFECIGAMPTVLQDKTIKLKNLMFTGYPLEGDWVEIVRPEYHKVKKYTDTGIVPIVNDEYSIISDDLPYDGYYDVSFYTALVDYQDAGGTSRVQTSSPHVLYFWDEVDNAYVVVDSGPQFTPLGTPQPFYNNSVQGSRIVKSRVIGGKNKIRFKVYSNQVGNTFIGLSGTYYSLSYVGKNI